MTSGSRLGRRVTGSALGVAFVLSLGGCERGCLRRAAERVIAPGGGDLPRIGGDLPATAACPDGLARCAGGRVLAIGRLPPDAKCSPEGCRCPWDDLGACERGCVLEGVEIEVPRSRARAQLCVPTVGEGGAVTGGTFAFPVPSGSLPAPAHDDGGEPTADVHCDIERYRCDTGVVFKCAGGALSVARCAFGCATEGGTLEAEASVEQATQLLCARAADPGVK